jgi:hypothetical protein
MPCVFNYKTVIIHLRGTLLASLLLLLLLLLLLWLHTPYQDAVRAHWRM